MSIHRDWVCEQTVFRFGKENRIVEEERQSCFSLCGKAKCGRKNSLSLLSIAIIEIKESHNSSFHFRHAFACQATQWCIKS